MNREFDNVVRLPESGKTIEYGEFCFTDSIMAEYVEGNVLEELRRVRKGQVPLTLQLAGKVAEGMRDWAIGKGVTHFCHWFQPLTAHAAGKQDSLVKPCGKGRVILELSASDLLKGESDASSFPTGGLRSTFEARGLMEWDASSPVFVREIAKTRVLYIPTKFLGFNGCALDLKTPLLRSVKSLSDSVSALLSAVEHMDGYGRIKVFLGPEQEYFLVDRDYFEKRPDLRLTGRTVLGDLTSVGVCAAEHYFAGFSERVQSFLSELNRKLWKTGIAVCTSHKEAAPNQFEVVLYYGTCNITCDQNVVLNDLMMETALHYGMVVLFDEKPFKGVNGSGKHTNWSIGNAKGENLLTPGKDGENTLRFLLMTALFVRAVDKFSSLLRFATASYSNDLRLSEKEAPPEVISVYLGDKLAGILDGGYESVASARLISSDSIMSDRNRTSPIAFTGNKFEVRMTGASCPLSSPATFINAAFADSAMEAVRDLGDSPDRESVAKYVADVYSRHSRVVYNDNCYAPTWKTKARGRGLDVIPDTPAALKAALRDENFAMLERTGVLSRLELESRVNIYLSSYVRKLKLEAVTMNEMVRKAIVPCVRDEIVKNAKCASEVSAIGCAGSVGKRMKEEFGRLLCLSERLSAAIAEMREPDDCTASYAASCRRKMIPLMEDLRRCADSLESLTDEKAWPYPSYDKLMFGL